MPHIQGPIKKLTGAMGSPIQYSLPIGDEVLPFNDLLGKQISMQYLDKISCIQCGRKTSKSFQQGFCYPCYKKLLDCNLCIIHPEKCNFPQTECPDTWEHEHCKQEHIIYLANSSGLKIGITRSNQVPTRWIDQGATQAVPLFKVSNRHQSGLIETIFKQYIADKTNWRKMLSDQIEVLDMEVKRQELLSKAEASLTSFIRQHETVVTLDEQAISLSYPIIAYPNKLTPLTFDKTALLEGKLLGIKGQYLLLESGVINLRKHSGYHLSIKY